jgi:hypothetical protein
MENTTNELQRMWKKDLVACHNALSEDRQTNWSPGTYSDPGYSENKAELQIFHVR